MRGCMSEEAEDIGELVLTAPLAPKLDAQLSIESYFGSNLQAASNLIVEPSTDEGVGVDLMCELDVPVVIDGDNESGASWLCDEVDEFDDEEEEDESD